MKPFNCVQIKLLMLGINTRNHLNVCKQMSFGSLKIIIYELFVDKSHRPNGLVGRVFDNGPGHRGLILVRLIPKTPEMILDMSLLNT